MNSGIFSSALSVLSMTVILITIFNVQVSLHTQMLQVNSPTSSEQDHAVNWKGLKVSTKPFPSMPNDPTYSASSIYCFGYLWILKTLYSYALLILKTLEVPIQISYRVDSEPQDQIQGLRFTYTP